MKKKIAMLLCATLFCASALTGCTFGFASDPDDPNRFFPFCCRFSRCN